MTGLKFFSLYNDGSINIASYHHPRSITWRWLLNFGKYSAAPGFRWGLFRWHRMVLLNVGAWTVRFQTQQAMWR